MRVKYNVSVNKTTLFEVAKNGMAAAKIESDVLKTISPFLYSATVDRMNRRIRKMQIEWEEIALEIKEK